MTKTLTQQLTAKTPTNKEIVTDREYKYEEAFEASKKYFKGDELAANVWVNKYALKNEQGVLLEKDPNDMHRRMAKELARVEQRYERPLKEEELFALLKDFKYIVPQGGPMTGIGNDHQVASLSNCFVIGNEGEPDSYGGVMKTDQEQVQLMKRRGGVGHDLSHLRPKGSQVKNSALSSTGVVPFMERFSNSTREVAQDGRRGALMLTISIEHPDAEDFIDAKLDGTKVTGANVSVRMTDAFMNAVKEGNTYTQRFPVGSKTPTVTKEVDAQALWKKVTHNAWKSAEPGVLFWDTVIRESIPDRYADLGFKTISTNPCGEIPLCPYDSCRLLAINLFSYVDEPFTEKARFNFSLFKQHAGLGLRIMDDIVDLEMEKIEKIIEKITNDPEPISVKRVELEMWEEIKKKCEAGRRTGVGVTAEGDMLAALGIRYGSDESIEMSTKVHKNLAIEAYRSSVLLAEQRGAFPIYDPEREKTNPFIQRIKQADPALYDEMVLKGRRNIAILTIAPTGTTSLMTQTTSGIEPVFMPVYKRRRKVNPNDMNARVDMVDELGDSWEEYHVFHHNFAKWLKLNGHDLATVEAMNADDLNKLIETSPYHKATANDVDWVQKVALQGSVQKWVDHSISVTVNVPNDVNEEMVAQIYTTGWESGCKGITVYRDGSRSGVLVADTPKEDGKEGKSEPFFTKRPKRLKASVIHFQNDHEKWIAVVGLLDGKPYEVFTGKAEGAFTLPKWVEKGEIIKRRGKKGKSRYDFRYNDKEDYRVTIEGLSRAFNKEYWNYAKLISGVLRQGMAIQNVVDLINGLHLNDESLNTWKNGLVRSLKRFIPNGTTAEGVKCPECEAEALTYEEGCLNCKDCGYSKCG